MWHDSRRNRWSPEQERSVYLQDAQLLPQQLIALATHKIMTLAHSSGKETVDWSFTDISCRFAASASPVWSHLWECDGRWTGSHAWTSGVQVLCFWWPPAGWKFLQHTQNFTWKMQIKPCAGYIYCTLGPKSSPFSALHFSSQTLVKQPLRESPSTKQARNGEPSVCSRASALKRCSAATSTCLEGNENMTSTDLERVS